MVENHCTNKHIHSFIFTETKMFSSIIKMRLIVAFIYFILSLYLYETSMCTINYDCICLLKHSLQWLRRRKCIYIFQGDFFFCNSFLCKRDKAIRVSLKILIMYKCFALIWRINPECQQKNCELIFFCKCKTGYK